MNRPTLEHLVFIVIFSLGSMVSLADTLHPLDYAQVEKVVTRQSTQTQWCFDVQVRHRDEGWSHYADAWQVLDGEGRLLAERVLYHPHVEEQPFTRSLCNIEIPEQVDQVHVRAKCNLHGFGEPYLVHLKRS